MLGVGACGGSGEGGVQLSSAERMARASAATEAERTVRVTMSVEFDGVEDPEQLAFSGEGVMDMRSGEADISFEASGVEMRELIVDGRGFIGYPPAMMARLGTDAEWLELDVASVASDMGFSNPGDSFAALGDIGGDVDEVGEETIDGVETTHFRSELASTGNVVEVWLDDDNRTRRIRMYVDADELLSSQGIDLGPDVEGAVTIEVEEYGVEVDVEAPPEDEIAPFEEVMRAAQGQTS
jgi:hypothetical protein